MMIFFLKPLCKFNLYYFNPTGRFAFAISVLAEGLVYKMPQNFQTAQYRSSFRPRHSQNRGLSLHVTRVKNFSYIP